MRVLFVTPECAPFAKAGGLGDVSAALPAALRALGIDVRVLLPGYPGVLAAAQAKEISRFDVLGLESRLLEAESLFILDCPSLYLRDGGPYQNAEGEDWPDNALRFGLLSKVAARLAWRPDVVHCNDWPAALTPVYLNLVETPRPATLLTIHNLAFQGNFEPSWVTRLGIPAAFFSLEGLEFYGRMSFLKGGLVHADAISTVSPSYAREMQSAEFGCGLDGVLRQRRGALEGILNGIDTAAWDPARDARIAERYDKSCLDKKALNKQALQRRLNLALDGEIPLCGFVGRLTHQKGVDLLAAAAAELAAMPVQLAVLGKGERELERAIAAAAARHPGRIAVALGFDEDLAHLVGAGADFFLMPSRFEPCGLNQMYSQRYGTPPVARATGGLADTISDGATGFLFERAERSALVAAVRRAAQAYQDRRRWREIQLAGMRRDFSWGAAARQYADLYSRLARK